MDTWFTTFFADVLTKLSAVTEGDRTLLDNSTVLFANHQASGGGHQIDGVKWFLAGSCGGYFAPGRLVEKNAPHNRVLIAMANAVVVETKTFGDPEYGEELAGLRA